MAARDARLESDWWHTAQQLSHHKATHRAGGKCGVCGKHCDTAKQLSNHKRTHRPGDS